MIFYLPPQHGRAKRARAPRLLGGQGGDRGTKNRRRPELLNEVRPRSVWRKTRGRDKRSAIVGGGGEIWSRAIGKADGKPKPGCPSPHGNFEARVRAGRLRFGAAGDTDGFPAFRHRFLSQPVLESPRGTGAVRASGARARRAESSRHGEGASRTFLMGVVVTTGVCGKYNESIGEIFRRNFSEKWRAKFHEKSRRGRGFLARARCSSPGGARRTLSACGVVWGGAGGGGGGRRVRPNTHARARKNFPGAQNSRLGKPRVFKSSRVGK